MNFPTPFAINGEDLAIRFPRANGSSLTSLIDLYPELSCFKSAKVICLSSFALVKLVASSDMDPSHLP
uniref:Uncharacterized protein n=1 Tax=uncultured marine virus TaxID=186617 RepID=A0A0F7LA32_9VIRU|nr:hypothetical protein [uncultured marine virus]